MEAILSFVEAIQSFVEAILNTENNVDSLVFSWLSLGWARFSLVWYGSAKGDLPTKFFFAFLLVWSILGCIFKISFVVCLKVL